MISLQKLIKEIYLTYTYCILAYTSHYKVCFVLKKRIDAPLLIIAIFILLGAIVLSYFGITSRINTLNHEKYIETSIKVKNTLEVFIQEKKEAVSLISFSLVRDSDIRNALMHRETKDLQLHQFTTELKEHTPLQYVGIQVISPEGISLYRSWTPKKGDSLLQARIDIAEGIKDPKIMNSISVGKFDLTFKTIIPIYEQGAFIGFIETIAKFNSIALKMQQKGIDMSILVDKRYKEQLKFPFTKKFVDDYYIANTNSKPVNEAYIKEKNVEHFIDTHDYRLAKDINKLITTFCLNDLEEQPMAYFLLFIDLDDIDFTGINRVRNRLILAAVLAILLLTSSFYYLYVKRYKLFVDTLNTKLEHEVAAKTLELEEKNKHLIHIAHHDSLTGLPNRLLFLDRLDNAIKYAKRHNNNVAVLFLDLDRFKEVNDTYGHEVGDKLLKNITQRLKACVRDYDTIARLGGDEFTIIIQGAENEQLISIVEKIFKNMKASHFINGNTIHSSFSIGISSFPEDGDNTDILLRNADTAMYKAKDKGRNTYKFYNEGMTAQVLKRVKLETELREAIEHNDFHAYYQPKLDAVTGKVIGMEALIRWIHHSHGMIPPDEFIPLAEEIGLIGRIDEWMMKHTLETAHKWHEEGIFNGRLSLNVSMKHIENKSFVDRIKEILTENNFKPELLELEITESQIMKKPQSTIKILNKIKSLGIAISIDDFGTGYSSLSYLKRLPIDRLKIDKSFIQDIPNDEDDTAIVKTIIVLAKSLKLDIIAEGVESLEQKDFLVASGCHHIQGYYYAKPLSEKGFRDFLIKFS